MNFCIGIFTKILRHPVKAVFKKNYWFKSYGQKTGPIWKNLVFALFFIKIGQLHQPITFFGHLRLLNGFQILIRHSKLKLNPLKKVIIPDNPKPPDFTVTKGGTKSVQTAFIVLFEINIMVSSKLLMDIIFCVRKTLNSFFYKCKS